MRIVETAIPATFQRLDTRINDANSFANVRDLQTIRKNHNILLARRCRNTLFTCRIGNEAGPQGLGFGGLRPADSYLGGSIVKIPFFSNNPYTKEITVEVYGSGSATYPCYMYFSVTSLDSVPQTSDTELLEFDSSSTGWLTINVPVRRDIRHWPLKMLTIMYRTPEGNSATKTPGNVVDVGPDWVVLDNAGGVSVGDMLISSVTGVEPRTAREVNFDILGGTNDRVYINGLWNIPPTIGSVLTPRGMQQVTAYTICAYEAEIATFEGDEDWNFHL